MPTITAQVIIDKAQIVLNDTLAVRWTEAELLGWLNDGQREIVILRPDANTTIGNIAMAAGTLQTLPAGGYQLIDLTRNMGAGSTPGKAIRLVPRELMDSGTPNWHASTASAVVSHYMYDLRSPTRFYVWPPATGGGNVEAVYSKAPTDVAAVGSVITLDDIYANPLTDYILYRAYSKNVEQPGAANRAAQARASFENTLGLKAQADAANMAATEAKG